MTAANPAPAKPPFVQPHICGRSACRAPNAYYWHKHLHAWYCQPCALSINEYTKDDGYGVLLTEAVPQVVVRSTESDDNVTQLTVNGETVAYEVWLKGRLHATCYEEAAVMPILLAAEATAKE